MPGGQDGPYRSAKAGADLSTKQYQCVVVDSAGLLQLASSAGGRIKGILQDDPTSGRAGTFKIRDGSKGKLGGSVVIGDLLSTDGAGLLLKSTSGQSVIAQAREAGSSNSVITVELGYLGLA